MSGQANFDERTVVPLKGYHDKTNVGAPAAKEESAVRRRGEAFARYGLYQTPTRVANEAFELPSLFDDDEDAPTIVREGSGAKESPSAMAEPPALPIALVRRSDDWYRELPPAARRVLDEASRLRPSWPMSRRLEHPVAEPLYK